MLKFGWIVCTELKSRDYLFWIVPLQFNSKQSTILGHGAHEKLGIINRSYVLQVQNNNFVMGTTAAALCQIQAVNLTLLRRHTMSIADDCFGFPCL